MRLFVGNLAFSVSDEVLHKHFTNNGFPPSDLRVLTDRETGKSRGFAFVSFQNEKTANDALTTLNGTMLAGRDLRISVAQDRPQNNGPNNRKPLQGQQPRQENVIRTMPVRAQTPQQPTVRQKPAYEEKSEPRQARTPYPPPAYEEFASSKGGDRRREYNSKKKRRRDEDDDDDWR
jgi:RNA recognition motif-containing protein